MILGAREPVTGESTRDRIVKAATALTCQYGWSWVTMGKLADAAGVTREAVYHEIGSKDQLAEAVILSELALFLEQVDAGFAAHPDDISAGIRDAVDNVLRFAEESALLQTIVSVSYGGASGLLPLITTQAGALIDTASSVAAKRLSTYDTALSEVEIAMLSDILVRIVLSHVTQPGAAREQVADALAWMLGRVAAPVTVP